jgi:hypothetical protein
MLHRSVFFTIAIACLFISTTVALGQTPYHAWSQGFGDPDQDRPMEMGVDDYGNLYVFGFFLGDIDLGGGVLTGAGGWDLFLAKYAPDGTHLWSQQFGSAASDYANGIAVDKFGFVSIVGRFSSTIDFGGGILTSAGGDDIFVAKFNPNGAHIWSGAIGSADAEIGRGVALDDLGNTTIIGNFTVSVTIESITHASQGGDDLILVNFDNSGNVMWSESFGGTSNDYAADVVADRAGNIILTTYAHSSIDFGGGLLPHNASTDIYLAKFGSDGSYHWSYVHGGGSSDYVTHLATDNYDNIFVTGYFYGTADFGGGNLGSQGNTDAFLAKYDPSGAHVWSYRFGDSASFGGNDLTSAGLRDIVVARYTPDGTHVWSRMFGGNLDDGPAGIAADPFGNVAILAEFQTAVDAGGGPLFSSGGYDVLLAKFYHGPVIHSILDVPGDQGGLVNVAWDACTGDNAADQAITDYTVWRAIDALAAATSLEDGAVQIGNASQVKSAPGQPLIRLAGAYYWYLVETVDAIALENYSSPTPTLYDSTDASSQYHYFQVIAHTADSYVYYTSEPDSGYSMDNIAPAAPQNLIAAQKASPAGLELTWNSNDEADLSHYVVFRGTHPGFVANSGSLLGESADTTAFDNSWQWDSDYWYKVFAVDIHGNMSPFAMLGPDFVTGVDGPALSSARLEQNVPNPFNPTTTIVFTIAKAGDVSLRVYDPAGRLIRTLVQEHRDAKTHSITWNGRNDAGDAVASGVYFYRLTAFGFEQTRRMVLLK